MAIRPWLVPLLGTLLLHLCAAVGLWLPSVLLKDRVMLRAADLTIRLHPETRRVIARVEIPAAPWSRLIACAPVAAIPAGHKLAVRDIAAGTPAHRYNQVIALPRAHQAGEARARAQPCHGGFREGLRLSSLIRKPYFVAQPATFMASARRRASGDAQLHRHPDDVNCSATVARMIARQFFENNLGEYPTRRRSRADAQDAAAWRVRASDRPLERTIAGYARHPNILLLAARRLGCEANQINELLSAQALKRSDRLGAFTIQEKGGTRKAVENGIARVKEMLPEANKARREPVPASHLVLGLQCGGSDGYSGISANPALGAAVDILVRNGGTAILSETPETTRRAPAHRRAVSRSRREADRAHRWWRPYRRDGHEMNTPDAGNKAGGLTTPREVARRGGEGGPPTSSTSTSMRTVTGRARLHGHPATTRCRNRQVAGGANMICFTTGPARPTLQTSPSIKLATKRPSRAAGGDMDINAAP